MRWKQKEERRAGRADDGANGAVAECDKAIRIVRMK
jgi:hypothetical protein